MSGPRLAVIGLGLIGGSLARAARAGGAADEIIGYDADAQAMRRAVELGVIDRAAVSPAEAASAQRVVLAVPVQATAAVLEQLKPGLAAGSVLSDTGSTKRSVIEAVRAVFGGLPPNFVGGHPIAGAERFGVEASNAELFRGRRVLLTPTAQTDPAATSAISSLWQACGATVSTMSPQHHDEVLAATSHLPHLLAYALVDCLAAMATRRDIFEYAAGGFRDFTRIASSSPQMWHDIVRANRDAILPVIDEFSAHLAALRAAVQGDDGAALLQTFERARAARERYLESLEK